MIFTKEDRDLLEEIKSYQYALRDASSVSFKNILACLQQQEVMLVELKKSFYQLQGFVENRIKPLSDEEKFEWAKSIIFSYGYVVVRYEDAKAASQPKRPAESPQT